MPTSVPMMAMTTSSSTSVKPERVGRMWVRIGKPFERCALGKREMRIRSPDQ